MDFGHAALLVGVVYGLTDMMLSNLPPTIAGNKTWKVLVALVCAEVAVFALGASVWAHEQVIGDHNLDNLEVIDKVIIGVILGGGASFLNKVIGSVRNIGENDRPKVSYNYFDKNKSRDHAVAEQRNAA